MPTDAARTPVVVAVGQSIERDEIVTPVDLAVRASSTVLDQAPGLAKSLERLTMVGVIFSKAGQNPASAIAERLGLGDDVTAEVTSAGGNTPQWLVTRAARDIAAGQLTATLITGAEATRSQRASGEAAGGLFQGDRPVAGDGAGDGRQDVMVHAGDEDFLGPGEINARLFLPAHVYPIFESAAAAAAGRSFAEQRAFLGAMLARFTDVAADHPYAWFPERATADELATVTPKNRLTAEPYTKRMNAFPNVDQGSALLVTSLAAAREAGLEDQAIFVWSGASTAEVRHPAARPHLGSSPAIAAAARRVFEAAGVGVDDISRFDFYSCFPIAVEAGAEAVGITVDDPRGLTVTGGLPYFGGPGNNYVGHSIATMVELLRETPGLGLCTALGGFITKHAIGIYGTEPPPRGFRAGDTAADQQAIDASAIEVTTQAEGEALVEGATVVPTADGTGVESAPVIARLDDGRRIVAVADPAALPDLAGRCLVGERVQVTGGPPPVYRI